MVTIGKMIHNGEYRVMYDDIKDREHPYHVVYRCGNRQKTLWKYTFKADAFRALAEVAFYHNYMPTI